MYPEELTTGNWGPLNFTVQRAFGCDAAVLFAHLSQVAKRYAAKKSDGWFYIGLPKLIEVTGMTRKPIERSIDILAGAGLLMIDKRGQNNTRHYQLVQTMEELEAICAAHAAAPAQAPDRAPKTQPRAKQTANAAKECEPAPEPIGKTEQLAPEKPKAKKPKTDPAEIQAAAVRLIEHLNAVAGTAFRTSGKVNIEKFARVLKAKEGTEEEVRMVIELKTMQWANNENMKSHLNPETLTRPKNFLRYLEECYNAKNQINPPRNAVGGFAAQDNNRYAAPSEQKKMDMILAQIAAHPGIDKHIPQQLFFPQYLASISEHEVQNQLRNARNQWTPPNFFSKTDEPPF